MAGTDLVGKGAATASGRAGAALDRWFVALAAVFGILFVFVTPPFQVPDEPAHFYRAYQIGQGRLFAERDEGGVGGMLPASLAEVVEAVSDDIPFHPAKKADLAVIRAALSVPLDPSRTGFVDFPNTAIYSFIPYLPQAVAIGVTRQLELSPLWLLYAGRLANLCASILLIGAAIRVTPVFRRGFLLIGLLPMVVSQMASVSADAFTNGLALLFTAHMLALAFGDERRVTPATTGLLMFLAALLAACKSAYFPLAFLVLLVPSGKAPSRRAHLAAAGLVIAAGLVSFVVWNGIAAETFVRFYGGGHTSFDAAQRFILEHPLLYARRVLANLYHYGFFYVHSFVGILGWLDAPLPVSFVAIEVLALAAVAVLDDSSMTLTRWQWALLFGVLAAAVVLVITSQFILWTKVTAGSINRAQGRYFVPVAPLAFLLLRGLRPAWRLPERAFTWGARLLSVGGLVLALVVVGIRYYSAG